MEIYKIVTLKDPVTGEKLLPRIPQGIQYEVVGDEITPPIDLTLDASTLEGHPADDFLLKSEASELYAAISHTHTISNIIDLQTELDSLKTSGSEGKSLIASAITAKGVSTASNATFQQMATNIGSISTMPGFITSEIRMMVNGYNPTVIYVNEKGVVTSKALDATNGDPQEIISVGTINVMRGGWLYMSGTASYYFNSASGAKYTKKYDGDNHITDAFAIALFG